MASEWAKKTAQNVVRPLKDRIYREISAENYDDTWDRVAEALDAARAKGRIEGLEEAAAIAANGSEHMCGSLWCNDEVALWCNDEVAHTRGDVAAEIRARIEEQA